MTDIHKIVTVIITNFILLSWLHHVDIWTVYTHFCTQIHVLTFSTNFVNSYGGYMQLQPFCIDKRMHVGNKPKIVRVGGGALNHTTAGSRLF